MDNLQAGTYTRIGRHTAEDGILFSQWSIVHAETRSKTSWSRSVAKEGTQGGTARTCTRTTRRAQPGSSCCRRPWTGNDRQHPFHKPATATANWRTRTSRAASLRRITPCFQLLGRNSSGDAKHGLVPKPTELSRHMRSLYLDEFRKERIGDPGAFDPKFNRLSCPCRVSRKEEAQGGIFRNSMRCAVCVLR